MRRIVIAGTESGVGKTTVTIGLMAALRQKGYTVQGFKCGPDYIDPTYHTAVTGRRSRNLDSWMVGHETVQAICAKGCEGADIAIIEGVMGLFDGKRPTTNEGTTAEISVLTKSPVLLVIDCSGMARSAAAIVRGFQTFDKRVRIAGVIANRVGSEGHFRLVKTAIEQECGIPVIGFLQKDDMLHIPERHLGLIPSIERGELDGFFAKLGERVAETVDLNALLKLSEAPALSAPRSYINVNKSYNVRIAVAKDAAFHFYYPENLELLQAYGAELVFFSPLAGEPLPDDVDGLYIGGGFPEEFAKTLSEQQNVKQSIKAAIESGLPTLAECGGFMFLTEAIETTDGSCYDMVGVIPGRVVMHSKLVALGYREVKGEKGNFLLPEGLRARGHEFHYSTYEAEGGLPFAYETTGLRGVKKDGYQRENLIAGYIHFHFASCPPMVENWLKRCKEVKERG
ncbi:cobyrinate a,c-diamide synthase [Parageobacillus thermoglucosidasius]|uniref:cobyrinate a,c-diamide synthase n=1 Tax=Parageobacillus thermoglucosidasius TaxID=1426 RepID=UPI0001D17075|nr:cobyrinate a,c-diamide synthase [Parageobacillus thermoglucosidasius]AEH48104.1 Cobyrinic acid A,C-diamide synthase [Parageobacillus thermoglucosidasius C56-YS93]RDE32763.1 cobyrinate a,c-diamide synthase [Parageobacillus thermoglucosidasius]REK54143.1 MAG: cobyrinate a,c-diamide synthase [Geobacillus sp.]